MGARRLQLPKSELLDIQRDFHDVTIKSSLQGPIYEDALLPPHCEVLKEFARKLGNFTRHCQINT